MGAEDNLRRGDLSAALADLEQEIRHAPADSRLRVFLFQLLCVMGRWDRALTQLNVAGELDPETLIMVHTYRVSVQCETLRSRVFAGEATPLLFGEPPRWVGFLSEALKLVAKGRYAESEALRTQAFAEAPPTPGLVDGHRVEWIADMDSRLGPVLEAIVDGKYYWIPFVRVRRITLEPPVDLRDLVWMPAQFVWANGGQSVGLIPTRYPGSENNTDDSVKLARRTEWREEPGDVFLGSGQRMLATDVDEHALMDLRCIELSNSQPLAVS